jgi:hypothetical protein
MAVTRYMRASNSSSTKQTLLARPGSARRFSARRRAKRFVFCCETTFRHAWIFFALTATEENRKAAPARSQADQAELWKIATAAAQAAPSPTTALFVESLNEMIDLDAKRVAGNRNHVPSSVWLLPTIVSATVCWCTGYATGRQCGRTVGDFTLVGSAAGDDSRLARAMPR